MSERRKIICLYVKALGTFFVTVRFTALRPFKTKLTWNQVSVQYVFAVIQVTKVCINYSIDFEDPIKLFVW